MADRDLAALIVAGTALLSTLVGLVGSYRASRTASRRDEVVLLREEVARLQLRLVEAHQEIDRLRRRGEGRR